MSQMLPSKTLLLLTNTYPYSQGEEFLETEMPYLASRFDRVIIIPTAHGVGAQQTRKVPGNVVLLPLNLDHSLLGKVRMLLRGLRQRDRWRGVQLSPRRALRHPLRAAYDTYFEMKALAIHDAARAQLVKQLPLTEVVLYSYWLFFPARVAVELCHSMPALADAPVVSRAHRYDVDVAVSPLRFLPEREFLLRHLTRIFPASAVMARRLREEHPDQAPKVQLRRLGTKGYVEAPVASQRPVRIVSCSSMIPLKRVDLLIEALALLQRSGMALTWRHFGTGPAKAVTALTEQASEALTAGSFQFEGLVPNTKILQAHATGGETVFVNVSRSEGVPVSVMEALCAGIPVIATDVGGTGEIVPRAPFDGLLSASCTAADVADRIARLVRLPSPDYEAASRAARDSWKQLSDAERNYGDFADELAAMVAAHDEESQR